MLQQVVIMALDGVKLPRASGILNKVIEASVAQAIASMLNEILQSLHASTPLPLPCPTSCTYLVRKVSSRGLQ